MSSNRPINQSNITAPTPQNTPLTTASVAPGLSRPTVPDISEAVEEDGDSDDDETGGPDFQQAMLGMVQGRLASLLGKSSGYIESLPVEVKRTVEGLKGVQSEYEKLQKEFKLEMWELERKVSSFSSVVCCSRQCADTSCGYSIWPSTSLSLTVVGTSWLAKRPSLRRKSLLGRRSHARTMKTTSLSSSLPPHLPMSRVFPSSGLPLFATTSASLSSSLIVMLVLSKPSTTSLSPTSRRRRRLDSFFTSTSRPTSTSPTRFSPRLICTRYAFYIHYIVHRCLHRRSG